MWRIFLWDSFEKEKLKCDIFLRLLINSFRGKAQIDIQLFWIKLYFKIIVCEKCYFWMFPINIFLFHIENVWFSLVLYTKNREVQIKILAKTYIIFQSFMEIINVALNSSCKMLIAVPYKTLTASATSRTFVRWSAEIMSWKFSTISAVTMPAGRPGHHSSKHDV